MARALADVASGDDTERRDGDGTEERLQARWNPISNASPENLVVISMIYSKHVLYYFIIVFITALIK